MTAQKIRTIQFLTPDELEEQLLRGMNLTKFAERWQVMEKHTVNEHEIIEGNTLFIVLSKAPQGCSEGRYVAYVRDYSHNQTKRKGWPKYFFDLYRARCEIENWLVFNGQFAGQFNQETTPSNEQETTEATRGNPQRDQVNHAEMGQRAA